jgi:hypothetical protein
MTCKHFRVVEVEDNRGFYLCVLFGLRIKEVFCETACKKKEEK